MFNMKKYIPLILLIFIVVLTSCDGRDKASRTSQQDLIDNKVLDSFSEVIKYLPEEYTEVSTDTILSNGFQVKIKTLSDMQNSVLNEVIIDSIKYKHYYRNYFGELKIYHDKSLILSQKIDKATFAETAKDFHWEDALMGQISLDQENTTTNEVFLDVFYCLVESEICKDFKLIIDQSGTLKIKEIVTTE